MSSTESTAMQHLKYAQLLVDYSRRLKLA